MTKQANATKLVSKALEVLPYWVGYKHSRFPNAELPEAAIVSELRELLFAFCDSTKRVRCEVAYRELGLSGQEGKKGRPIQADLVIEKKLKNNANGHPIAVIEVKRGKSINGPGDEDLETLSKLKRESITSGIKTFFVLVCEAGRPTYGLTQGGSAKRGVLKRGRVTVKVRRVTRAIGYRWDSKVGKAQSKQVGQFWAVLYEVM